jgi:zinc transport system ATP-binding protein
MRYITVEDLSFYYDKEPVLEHINYSVDSGEFVTLTGENGAAKTTLIKASLGILQPRIGKVTISKTNTQGKKLRIAYLPQQIASFNAGFPSTVYEFVKSGRYPRKGWFRRLNAHDEEHIKASLDSVGMWEHRDKRLGSLSGGQKQRAVIARMFASDPDVFILDEPTTGMDAGSKNEFYELMHHSAHHHGKAVLMITHDPEEVKDYADRNIHLVRNQDSPWRCFNVHENDQEVLESETNLEILLKGWKLVARVHRLRLFVSANLLEIFSNTIWVSSIILVFVTELLNETESYWGYSNTAYSIGIIISGLIAFRLSEKFLAAKWESILFPLVAMAIVTLTILYFPNAQIFLVFSALVGMLSQLKEVPESVFLQETVEENNLVNVYSVLEVISTLAFSVFVLLMSYITESFGISISFWLSAICLMIEAILIYIRRDYFK